MKITKGFIYGTIYNDNITINNFIFHNNTAKYGSTVYNNYENIINIINCSFIDNIASNSYFSSFFISL